MSSYRDLDFDNPEWLAMILTEPKEERGLKFGMTNGATLYRRVLEKAAEFLRTIPSANTKTDGVSLVPARIALNLCRSIGERNRQKQEAFVRELADWLSSIGNDDLGGYALAQIGAIPTKGEEG